LRNKINEIACDIVCIQETKRDEFNEAYIWNFCPMPFYNFCFSSIEASGGVVALLLFRKVQDLKAN
jgi:exonuclease III